MTRPQYETNAQRSREWACACRFAHAFNYSFHKLGGQYSRLDGLCLPKQRGQQPVWLEVKCRTHAFAAYPTLLLSAAKWREGVEMAASTGALFVLCVEFTDGDYVYVHDAGDFAAGHVWLDYGGRTNQTRDAGDIEPVVHIAVRKFSRIPAKELP